MNKPVRSISVTPGVGEKKERFRIHVHSGAMFFRMNHTMYLHIYVEYRVVSGVLLTIDPHPLSTQRVCPPPAPKAVGGGG
jgi:hypothetical protein